MFFSTGPDRVPLRKRLCDRDIHWTHTIKTMMGGAGPDEAGWIVECSWCGRQGWKCFDGTIKMYDIPIVDRDSYRIPDSSVTVVTKPSLKRLPWRIRGLFYFGAFHSFLAFFGVFFHAWASVITCLVTSILLFLIVFFSYKSLIRVERNDDKPT